MPDKITTTLTFKSGGKSQSVVLGEKQLELDGMPKPEKKVKQSDPYFEAFELSPFVPAPEVQAIADELIPQFHSSRWRTVPEILYLFSGKPLKAQGNDAIATCRLVRGVNAYLYRRQFVLSTCRDADEYNRRTHGIKFESDPSFNLPPGKHVIPATPLFVVTWWHQGWKYAEDELKRAVTDHELQHVGVEDSEKGKGDGFRYFLVPHSVQEFDVIVERYGAYAGQLKKFQAALQSGELARREGKSNG